MKSAEKLNLEKSLAMLKEAKELRGNTLYLSSVDMAVT